MRKVPNQVRIISGKWRGRKVDFLPRHELRPTGDKIRETAFNWLQVAIIDARCLDLFSGSGVFGFESLSRGASRVVLVDQDAQVKNKLLENAEKLGAQSLDVWLDRVPSDSLVSRLDSQQFDIVFLDPPFRQGLVTRSIEMLQASRCLADGALIYIECEAELGLDSLSMPEGWSFLRSKQAGNVAYCLVETG